MRGPVVYCIEEKDNEAYFASESKPELITSGLKAEFRDDLLGGVTTLSGSAVFVDTNKEINITAIPYYTWNNRGAGHMKVWIPVQTN